LQVLALQHFLRLPFYAAARLVQFGMVWCSPVAHTLRTPSYADLHNFSDLIARTVEGAPETSKGERRDLLPQVVYLEYSRDRLAEYGLQPAALGQVLRARNIIAPGGEFETGQRQITINPSGQFESRDAIGAVALSKTSTGAPVYLRDLVKIFSGYQSPAMYLNYCTWQDPTGQWQRSRAVTLALYMRDQQQIAQFGQSVDGKLSQLRQILPADLIIAHTSDQPLQVNQNIHLFLRALVEAIILVVGVSLIGFWEWRLALIMALAIPITLAMTFGVTYVLGIDLQRVSVATLIIALGLLVDVPVVAGDGIKRGLAEGLPRREIGPNHSLHRLPCFLNLPPETTPQIPRNGRFVQPQLPRREVLPVRLHLSIDGLPLLSRDALQQSIVQVVNRIRDQTKGFVPGDE
jgi:multidrug efflux pump subunit AcrB